MHGNRHANLLFTRHVCVFTEHGALHMVGAGVMCGREGGTADKRGAVDVLSRPKTRGTQRELQVGGSSKRIR